MARTSRDGGAARVVAAAVLTSTLAPIGASLLLIALPQMQRSFSISEAAAGSAVTAYLIVMVIGQPLGGRLGDRYGRRRALRTGTLLLAGASVFGAVAPDFPLLLAARFAQALAGSLAFPNAFAVIRNAVPAARRGRILGGLGAAIVVSSAAAIPLGQLIVHLGGWRSTFVATAALAVPAYLLQTWRQHDQARGELQVSDEVPMSDGERRPLPRSGAILAASVALGATNGAMYAVLVAVALGAAGHAAGSLILFAFLCGAAVGAPVGGRAADHIGRVAATAAGLATLLIGLTMMLRPSATPQGILILGTILAGLGIGMTVTALQTIPADVTGAIHSGRAAGWLASARYLGAAAGSLTGSVLADRQLAGENAALVGAVVAVLVAAIAAAGLVRQGAAYRQTARGEPPNQRARRWALKSRFSTATSGDGATKAPLGERPDSESTSTRPTLPLPNST